MRCFIGIDLGSTTKGGGDRRAAEHPRPRHHQLALELRHRRRGGQTEALISGRFRCSAGRWQHRARSTVRSTASSASSNATSAPSSTWSSWSTWRPPAARHESAFGDAPVAVAGADEVFGRWSGGAGAVRGRVSAERLLPRHRRQPVPGRWREAPRPLGIALRLTCSACSTARSSRSRTASTATRCAPPARALEPLRRAAATHRQAAPRSPRRSGRARHRRWRDLRRRHRLRPRTAARSARSTSVREILCHGLGAHVMYPGTATVLDIGGQDTKAIQVDRQGIVEASR